MPPAARILDPIACAIHVVPPSPTTGIVQPRVGTVNIGFLPAARMGDKVQCVTGSSGNVLKGELTVRIEGQPAARMGDSIGHGVPTGVIQMGCPTVNIGMLPQVATLQLAAKAGAPFCEECAERGAQPAKKGA